MIYNAHVNSMTGTVVPINMIELSSKDIYLNAWKKPAMSSRNQNDCIKGTATSDGEPIKGLIGSSNVLPGGISTIEMTTPTFNIYADPSDWYLWSSTQWVKQSSDIGADRMLGTHVDEGQGYLRIGDTVTNSVDYRYGPVVRTDSPILTSATNITLPFMRSYVGVENYLVFSDTFSLYLINSSTVWSLFDVDGVRYSTSQIDGNIYIDFYFVIIDGKYITLARPVTTNNTDYVYLEIIRTNAIGYQNEFEFFPMVGIANLNQFFPAFEPPQRDDPMNSEETDSGEAGGDGTFDFTDELITFPQLPTAEHTPLASRMFTIFIPTVTQFQKFTDTFWNTNLLLLIQEKLGFPNPYEAVMAMHLLPYSTTKVGTTPNAMIGGTSTNVAMDVCGHQYGAVNFGELVMERSIRGNFLDYAPYTKITAHMPFYGEIELDPSDVYGHTLSVHYIYDITTGFFVGYILRDGSPMHTFTGNFAVPIPVTGRDASAMFDSILGIVSKGVGIAGAVVGGLAGGITPASAVSTAGKVASTVGAETTPFRQSQTSLNGVGSALLMPKTAYIDIDTVREVIPTNYAHNVGHTSNIPAKLSTQHGYTVAEVIHIDGVGCLPEERAEIQRLLSEGVYLP